jgi:lipid II:glycine glycyltransferase (peptidoglycan interpeptide bridge formation enzyme)
MLDIRQTPAYARYLKSIGWQVERINEVNYFIKKLPLMGSIIKIQRPEEIKIKKINELAKKYKSFQIIIEPKSEMDARYLISIGYKKSKRPYLPTKTLHLELTHPQESLINQMKKDAKRAIKKTEDLEIHEPTISCFRDCWKKAVGLKRYVPAIKNLKSLKKNFRKNCLFLLTKEGSAGAIFLMGDKIALGQQAASSAYYWQAFSNQKGRKTLAQYKIVWEGILWAKKHGAKIFDFEGIYDKRFPNKKWKGFTHFKKSFGGYEVSYPGAFVKNLVPFKLQKRPHQAAQ